MDVAVDAARHDQQAGGVDHARPVGQLVGDGDDLAAAHADVGAECVGRGHHLAAADDQFELAHRRLAFAFAADSQA